ncbi:MAG: galactokinase family protein, partial [bacterium]|nr:galactokinase family protein [bacterium]
MQIKDKINSGAFDGIFEKLYGNIDAARTRFCDAVDCFGKYFEYDGELSLFSAPGRTEVGGNHTDHQHGCVLAGSVNLDVIAVVSRNDSGMVRIKSEGFDMDEVSITDLAPNNEFFGRSSELIKGMLYQLQLAGYSISGFNAYTTSNVLKGSGLSSSAAFEVLIGVIISGLYNDGMIDAVEIAKMAQKAENLHFGKPCGLMDQMACSVGGFTAIDFSDVHNPVIEKVDFDLSAEGYSLCIVNTGGNHADLTDDYADITVECKQVSEFFG